MAIIASALKKVIAALLAVLTMVAPGTLGISTKDNKPMNTKTCLLSFAALSDTHIYDVEDDNNNYSTLMFNLVMGDIAEHNPKQDALVIAGDITDDGEEPQWQNAVNLFSTVNPAERILMSIGNHDTWTEESKKSAQNLFVEYSNKITGNKIKKVYYSTKVNGYYFIFLGSEKAAPDAGAYFSNKQISWLDAEMKKAAKTNKPIFVVSHWPLNKTHGLPASFGDDEYNDNTGGMGQQNAKVKKILNKYKNVFLISGHIHSGFSNKASAEKNGYQSVETYGNITSLNLPCGAFANGNGHFLPGSGYNVEVYKNKVIFRARSFAAGCWLPDYDYTIRLK